MRFICLILMLLPIIFFGQKTATKNKNTQTSSIVFKGNNNIIKVLQGRNIISFNLGNPDDYQKFLTYLKTIPAMEELLIKILNENHDIKKSQREIIAKLTKIDKDRILDNVETNKATEEYIRENERLKIQIEQYNKKVDNLNSTSAVEEAYLTLEKAYPKLINYDNQGFQEILENYKKSLRHTLIEDSLFSVITYYQAASNNTNYKYDKALEQINGALNFDKNNSKYLGLKASILSDLYRSSESTAVYELLVTTAQDDSLKTEFYSRIAMNYFNEDKYDQALANFDSALNINLKISSQGDRNTAEIYSGAAVVYEKLGNYNEALRCFSIAIDIQQKIFKEYNLEVANSCINLGALLNNLEKPDSAIIYLNKGFKIEQKSPEGNNIILSRYYNNIGYSYNLKNDPKKALESFNKALDILKKLFGYDNINTAMTYNNIGLIYQKSGKLDTALFFYLKALAIREKVLGKGNSSTALCYNNIGTIYLLKKDYSQAQNNFKKVLDIRLSSFGEQNINTADIYNSLGVSYEGQGNYNKALENYKKALQIRQSTQYIDTNILGSLYFQIGVIYAIQEDITNATSYFNKLASSPSNQVFNLTEKTTELLTENKLSLALNVSKFTLHVLENNSVPKSDFGWITTYNEIASLYCSLGEKDKAKPFFEKALSMHPNVKEGKLMLEAIRKNYNDCK